MALIAHEDHDRGAHPPVAVRPGSHEDRERDDEVVIPDAFGAKRRAVVAAATAPAQAAYRECDRSKHRDRGDR